MANQNDDGVFAFILGMLLGGAAGAATAILFTPKKGDDMREDMKAFLKTLPEKVEDDFSSPNGHTRKFIRRAKMNIENKVDEVNQSIRNNRMADAKRREDMALGGVDYN